MIRNYLLFIFILNFLNIISQNNIIPNFDFEKAQPSKTPQCSYGSAQAFDADILNWRVAYHKIGKDEGTPDWFAPANCTNDGICGVSTTFANTTRQVILRANVFKCRHNGFENFHEAIAVSLENNSTFTQNKNYIIRYKITPSEAKINKTANNANSGNIQACLNSLNPCHMRIFLSEWGHLNWNSTFSQKQELINANYQFPQSPNPLNCVYTVEERKFTPNSSLYTTLVFYTESGGVIIDDVEVFEECESTYYVQNKTYANPYYLPNSVNGLYNFAEKSSDAIIVGKNVTSTRPQGDVVIKAAPTNFTSPYVTYTAANRITFYAGFKAEKGARFRATLLPCPNSYSKGTEAAEYSNPNLNYVALPPLPSDEESLNSTTSIDSNTELKIIPNPNNGKFTLYLDESLDLPVNVTIQNTMLQTIQEFHKIPDYSLEIDLREASNGIYFVKISYLGSTVIRKIIKD